MMEILEKLKSKEGKILTTDEYAVCMKELKKIERMVEEITLKSGEDYLLLKWGTLKSWDFKNNKKCKKLFEEYCSIGTSSAGCMTQKDTDKQREIICGIIDNISGFIQEDWGGEYLTKEEAKKYVMEYRK